MTPQQVAEQHALHVAAELLRLDVQIPDTECTGTVTVRTAKLRVTVTIMRYDADTPISLPPPPPTLRPVEQAAYDACPLPVEMPVTVKTLARRAKYCCNSYFREAVRHLVDMGLLVKCTGGVKKA